MAREPRCLTAAGAVGIAAAIGIPIGLVAGFFGGWRDAVLMRAVDVLLALPGILFAMAMIAVIGRSQAAALIAVGVTGIPSFARVTRAQVLSLRKRDFVTAVEAFGGASTYNMFRTILPNSWSPIFVQVVVLASVAILLEAALAFLGVGIPPPTPSWGEMLRTGKSFLHDAPYYAVLPGIVLTLTILSFDSIGRALTWLLEGGQDLDLKVERAKAMIGYVLRRIMQLLPVLLIASLCIWAMIYAVPGGPMGVIVGENATQEQIDAATKQFGLDRPVLVQYGAWLVDALRGDLGVSIHSREPVLDLIAQRLPATLQLAVASDVDCSSAGNSGRHGERAFPEFVARSDPQRMERARARRADLLARNSADPALRRRIALASLRVRLCAVLGIPLADDEKHRAAGADARAFTCRASSRASSAHPSSANCRPITCAPPVRRACANGTSWAAMSCATRFSHS